MRWRGRRRRCCELLRLGCEIALFVNRERMLWDGLRLCELLCSLEARRRGVELWWKAARVVFPREAVWR